MDREFLQWKRIWWDDIQTKFWNGSVEDKIKNIQLLNPKAQIFVKDTAENTIRVWGLQLDENNKYNSAVAGSYCSDEWSPSPTTSYVDCIDTTIHEVIREPICSIVSEKNSWLSVSVTPTFTDWNIYEICILFTQDQYQWKMISQQWVDQFDIEWYVKSITNKDNSTTLKSKIGLNTFRTELNSLINQALEKVNSTSQPATSQ